jgi:hypothetical protein
MPSASYFAHPLRRVTQVLGFVDPHEKWVPPGLDLRPGKESAPDIKGRGGRVPHLAAPFAARVGKHGHPPTLCHPAPLLPF